MTSVRRGLSVVLCLGALVGAALPAWAWEPEVTLMPSGGQMPTVTHDLLRQDGPREFARCESYSPSTGAVVCFLVDEVVEGSVWKGVIAYREMAPSPVIYDLASDLEVHADLDAFNSALSANTDWEILGDMATFDLNETPTFAALPSPTNLTVSATDMVLDFRLVGHPESAVMMDLSIAEPLAGYYHVTVYFHDDWSTIVLALTEHTPGFASRQSSVRVVPVTSLSAEE
ncbi:MAG: hypothetical protein KC561_09695 [Myxococcales bacterium]|nr:hypothetical protein [Myxococcales bacterium]